VEAGEDIEKVILETASQDELAAAQQAEEEPIDLGKPWTRSGGEVEQVEGAKYVQLERGRLKEDSCLPRKLLLPKPPTWDRRL